MQHSYPKNAKKCFDGHPCILLQTQVIETRINVTNFASTEDAGRHSYVVPHTIKDIFALNFEKQLISTHIRYLTFSDTSVICMAICIKKRRQHPPISGINVQLMQQHPPPTNDKINLY